MCDLQKKFLKIIGSLVIHAQSKKNCDNLDMNFNWAISFYSFLEKRLEGDISGMKKILEFQFPKAPQSQNHIILKS